MRRLLLILLIGCGRISFEIGEPSSDGPIGDGPVGDGLVGDGPPRDGPLVRRACHSDVRYVGATGLTNTYREGTNTVSWNEARLECMVDDADLWVVESATEQTAFLGDWTGITDDANENVWRKVDGTLATFLPFLSGQPDGGAAENCLRNDGGGFEDRECTDQRDYVCECPAP